MQVLSWDKQTQKKIRRDYGHVFDKTIFKKVNRILAEVRQRGDLAIRRFTREFDGLDLPLKRIRVSQGDINRAFEKIQVPFVPILRQITDNVKEYYERELKQSFEIPAKDGVYLAKRYQPLERVGIYIPGGTSRVWREAPYRTQSFCREPGGPFQNSSRSGRSTLRRNDRFR